MDTSHSKKLNEFTQKIWRFCLNHNVWPTTVHIPGKNNADADTDSRKNWRETEYALNSDIVEETISNINVCPNIDLVASRLNYKIKPYASYQPYPEAFAINAFSFSWNAYTFYVCPPFWVILETVQKIAQDRATGLLVVSHWPTQPWWPYLVNMLFDHPIYLPKKHTVAPSRTSTDTSAAKSFEISDMPFVAGLLQGTGFSQEASNIIEGK